MNHPIYDHDRYLTDTECADVRAGQQAVRSFNSSAQHWVIVGASLGILAGVAVVAVALHLGGVL